MGTLSTRFYTVRFIESYFNKNIDDISIIDIGCSNRPLTENCDTFDLPDPYYPDIDTNKIMYKGDAKIASTIVDKKYDVIYSSHLLEDFHIEDIKKTLIDWYKFLNPGGIIVLVLPDQQMYIKDCIALNKKGNKHHIYKDFGLQFFKNNVLKGMNLKVVQEMEFYNNKNWDFEKPRQQYNFLIGVTNDI